MVAFAKLPITLACWLTASLNAVKVLRSSAWIAASTYRFGTQRGRVSFLSAALKYRLSQTKIGWEIELNLVSPLFQQ